MTEQLRTINVWEYRVTGNSLIDQTLVERVVYTFLEPYRSINDVGVCTCPFKDAGVVGAGAGYIQVETMTGL